MANPERIREAHKSEEESGYNYLRYKNGYFAPANKIIPFSGEKIGTYVVDYENEEVTFKPEHSKLEKKSKE